MVTSQNAIRKFKLGASIIDDPAPNLSFEESYKLLCQAYPLARHTVMFEEDALPQTDGSLLYEIPKIKAHTNG